MAIFEGVEQFVIKKEDVDSGINLVDLMVEKSTIFPSKGEARKMIQGGGVGINKAKVESAEVIINSSFLINNKYILVQKGKKNYFVITVS